jgi:hypothetical protein
MPVLTMAYRVMTDQSQTPARLSVRRLGDLAAKLIYASGDSSDPEHRDLPTALTYGEALVNDSDQYAPKPPVDPKAEAAMLKIQQTATIAREDNQADMQLEVLRQNSEDRRKSMDLQVRKQMNDDDNATAATIAAAEINSGERVSMSTGGGSGPNP